MLDERFLFGQFLFHFLCVPCVLYYLHKISTNWAANERTFIHSPQCAIHVCDPVMYVTPTPVVAYVLAWPTASTVTDACLMRGIWCRALAADPARVLWVPHEPSATVKASVRAESATTDSGARDVSRVTTDIHGVDLAVAISLVQHSAEMVSANATTKDSVLARWVGAEFTRIKMYIDIKNNMKKKYKSKTSNTLLIRYNYAINFIE